MHLWWSFLVASRVKVSWLSLHVRVIELCLRMTAWIIIAHVLLLKIMRFWSDRVWCVSCGYGPVIFIVIWVINSRAGWVQIWQYRAYMSSHYRWNISTRVLTCITCLRCRNPIVCVLVLLLSDYQLYFDST